MVVFFFFNDTATTEIYTLSLHDALPIWGPGCASAARGTGGSRSPRRRRGGGRWPAAHRCGRGRPARRRGRAPGRRGAPRSEEHTSELQSRQYLVCRLLLEKKKKLLQDTL